MNQFVYFCNIVTLSWSLYLAYTCYKKVGLSSRYLIYFFFFLLYVAPLALDLLVGLNEYPSKFIGFIIAQEDIQTSLIYDFFVLFTQLVLVYYPRRFLKFNMREYNDATSISDISKYLWWMAFIAPIGLVLLTGSFSILFAYQWRELRIFELPANYSLIEHLSYIGITASVLLFFSKHGRYTFLKRLLSFTLFYMNICVEGKRAILFFALVNVVAVLIIVANNSEAKLRNRLIMFVLIVISAFYMFTLSVKTKVGRGYEANSNEMATHLRIDFFRDDRVRMAIFAESHPSRMTILESTGQTLIPNLLSFEPLNYITMKLKYPQIGYQTYFTGALEGYNGRINLNNRDDYNYMTVTVAAEILSNFGLIIGILLFPFVCVSFSNIMESVVPLMKFLVFQSFVLLNLFSFQYVALYIEVCFLVMYFLRYKVQYRYFRHKQYS